MADRSTPQRFMFYAFLALCLVLGYVLFYVQSVELLVAIGTALAFLYASKEVLGTVDAAFTTFESLADANLVVMIAVFTSLLGEYSLRVLDERKEGGLVFRSYVALAMTVTVATVVLSPLLLFTPKYGFAWFVQLKLVRNALAVVDTPAVRRGVVCAYAALALVEASNTYAVVWLLRALSVETETLVLVLVFYVFLVWTGLVAIFERLTEQSFFELVTNARDAGLLKALRVLVTDTRPMLEFAQIELEDVEAWVPNVAELESVLQRLRLGCARIDASLDEIKLSNKRLDALAVKEDLEDLEDLEEEGLEEGEVGRKHVGLFLGETLEKVETCAALAKALVKSPSMEAKTELLTAIHGLESAPHLVDEMWLKVNGIAKTDGIESVLSLVELAKTPAPVIDLRAMVEVAEGVSKTAARARALTEKLQDHAICKLAEFRYAYLAYALWAPAFVTYNTARVVAKACRSGDWRVALLAACFASIVLALVLVHCYFAFLVVCARLSGQELHAPDSIMTPLENFAAACYTRLSRCRAGSKVAASEETKKTDASLPKRPKRQTGLLPPGQQQQACETKTTLHESAAAKRPRAKRAERKEEVGVVSAMHLVEEERHPRIAARMSSAAPALECVRSKPPPPRLNAEYGFDEPLMETRARRRRSEDESDELIVCPSWEDAVTCARIADAVRAMSSSSSSRRRPGGSVDAAALRDYAAVFEAHGVDGRRLVSQYLGNDRLGDLLVRLRVVDATHLVRLRKFFQNYEWCARRNSPPPHTVTVAELCVALDEVLGANYVQYAHEFVAQQIDGRYITEYVLDTARDYLVDDLRPLDHLLDDLEITDVIHRARLKIMLASFEWRYDLPIGPETSPNVPDLEGGELQGELQDDPANAPAGYAPEPSSRFHQRLQGAITRARAPLPQYHQPQYSRPR